MSMPIYLMFIRVLLSVEFCFTLKTYLKGAPFYNASASGKSPSDQSTTSSRSPEAGLKLEYFTEVEKFKNSPRWPAWSEIPNPQPNPQNAMSCTTSAYFGSPRGLCKSLYNLFTQRCHGRGREFESRRPRHSFQKSKSTFGKSAQYTRKYTLSDTRCDRCRFFLRQNH